MRWPPYKHVFFDCDSTLTTIEGIDFLADASGKGWRVEVLTKAAMDGEVELEDVYDKRLRAVNPTREQILDIRRAYKKNIVEDAIALIESLQYLGHQVYIISGGLLEPVREFGVYLGVKKENIRAVGVQYNQLSGQWWVNSTPKYLSFEEGSLTISDGKALIIKELLNGKKGRSIFIGDGQSDLLASRAVDLFVGYGGVQSRESVKNNSPIFIRSRSLAPLLPLAAGPASLSILKDTQFYPLGQQALDLNVRGEIQFNDEQLRTKFNEAIASAHKTIHPRANGGSSGDFGRPSTMDDWTPDAGVHRSD